MSQGEEQRRRAAADLETTRILLDRLREGDESARDRLVARFLPGLRRWARGRLPNYARSLMDTDDLVQVTLLRALGRVREFEHGREGAFLSYLHQILMNCVRDEIRRVPKQLDREADPTEVAEDRPALLEQTLGRGSVESYERALEALNEDQKMAVMLRIEFGFSYPEIAEALGRASANSVRMQVSRALVQLAERMDARA